MATQVPQEIKKTVTFIFIKTTEGRLVANGTGFFVGVQNEKNTEAWHVYLVTAKHVLWDKQGNYYPSVFIRLNRIAGDAEIIELPLTPPSDRVYTHEQSGVDIAVIPCLPDRERYDLKFIPQDMLVTRERFLKANIQEGDEVFFTGLFVSHIGQKRNYPIVRFGRVALITDEPVDWKGQLLELYLVECQSFGGNSGSPVFFYFGATRTPGVIRVGAPQILLAGVMKGSFLSPSEIQVVDTTPTPVSVENAGIAGVVPAFKLYEILFSARLKTIRSTAIS
jgi:hypothetical protein